MKIDIGYNSEKLIQIKRKIIYYFKKAGSPFCQCFLGSSPHRTPMTILIWSLEMPLIIKCHSYKLHGRASIITFVFYIIIYFL